MLPEEVRPQHSGRHIQTPETGIWLRANGLRKSFRKRTVVNDVSLEIRQGEVVALLGPNGAGKTTTFYMIVGLERPDQGQILLGGEEITQEPMYARARSGISYLPQEPSIFQKLTVEQNIMAILETLTLSRTERHNQLERLLSDLDIAHVRRTKGYALSGGERRRTEIARCLTIFPKFMLLDEPFAGIDPLAVVEIQEIIERLRREGIGILITDHNVPETLAITDRAYIISDGRIIATGTGEKLAADPEVRRVYLGEKFRL